MTEPSIERRELLGVLARHQTPILRRSLGQIATTFLPFFALMGAMYAAVCYSMWAGLALVLPAAGLVVRIFIIQHDCGHGALFRTRAANDWMGRFCSVITMTPYANWRRQHANHHAVWNNLDLRSDGLDIYSTCLTLREYRARSRIRRWIYRVGRHPLVVQLLLPPFVFMVLYRLPFDTPHTWRQERISVWLTNAAVGMLLLGAIVLFGAGRVLLVQVPTMAIASIIGAWIFSVQHRFEHVLWARHDSWNATNAALYGSSHLKLPRLLQWFSGNIGFHHVHHLAPRMPNYRLEECHHACAQWFDGVTSLTLWQALRAPLYLLWDEDRGRMIRLADIDAAGGRSPRVNLQTL